MSFTGQDRYLVSEVTFSNSAFAPLFYESEWFPADSSTYFEFNVSIDDFGLVGMEFSNTKGGDIVNTVAERAIANTLCSITGKSQGLWVRFFIRELGLASDGSQSAGPFTLDTSGFYYKQETTGVSTRIDALSAWGNLGSAGVETDWVQTGNARSMICQVNNANTPFDIVCQWSDDGFIINASDSFLGNSSFLDRERQVKGRYVRIIYTDETVPNKWSANFFLLKPQ